MSDSEEKKNALFTSLSVATKFIVGNNRNQKHKICVREWMKRRNIFFLL